MIIDEIIREELQFQKTLKKGVHEHGVIISMINLSSDNKKELIEDLESNTLKPYDLDISNVISLYSKINENPVNTYSKYW
jgi:hypothetical protein